MRCLRQSLPQAAALPRPRAAAVPPRVARPAAASSAGTSPRTTRGRRLAAQQRRQRHPPLGCSAALVAGVLLVVLLPLLLVAAILPQRRRRRREQIGAGSPIPAALVPVFNSAGADVDVNPYLLASVADQESDVRQRHRLDDAQLRRLRRLHADLHRRRRAATHGMRR